MRIFKLFVGLFPKWFRNILKRNPKLTSMYSRNLQKSGYFYGFPTRQKLDALYSENIKEQNLRLHTLSAKSDMSIEVLVIVPPELCQRLLDTLLSVPIDVKVYVMCVPEDFIEVQELVKVSGKANVDVLIEHDENCVFQHSILAIFSGDMIHPNALSIFQNYHEEDVDVSYCDKDRLTDGKRNTPCFFPNWDPDLQLTTGYVSSGVWIRRPDSIMKYLNCKVESVALMMAHFYLNGSKFKIGHIPFVLIHMSAVSTFNYKYYAKVLNDFNPAQLKLTAQMDHEYLQPVWLLKYEPLVSLIIPTKDELKLVKTCINSILASKYQNFEILLINNNSTEQKTLDYFEQIGTHKKIQVLSYSKPFNYSAINNFAVSHAKGDVIGLINNDIEVIDNSWLNYMVSHVCREDVGCVGAKLLYPDDRVQHAGVVMGYGGGAGHAHKYFPRYHSGYLKRLVATNSYSAVTAACLLVKKTDFNAVNGLNEELAVAFNDVDFCLRIKGLGRRNLLCTEALLYHHESVSRGREDTKDKILRFEGEVGFIKKEWKKIIEDDPCYNPNLTLKRENFSIKEKDE